MENFPYTYTRSGATHLASGIENQDSFGFYQDENFIFIALADGVSSVSMAKTGSEIACETAKKLFTREDRYMYKHPEDIVKQTLINEIQINLKKQANADKTNINEYASTLSVVLIDKTNGTLMTANLGDGIGFGTIGNKVKTIAKPRILKSGCFVTTTKNVAQTIAIAKYDLYKCNSVILMTDGAWHLIYENEQFKNNCDNAILSSDFFTIQLLLELESNKDDCSFIALDLNTLRKEGKL